MFVRGCPCLRTGVDLATGLQAILGNSPPRLRSRRCTSSVFAGPLPRRRLPGFDRAVWLFERFCLAGRDTTRGDLPADRPDEAGELTGDRGDGDGLALALPEQRPVARAE